MTQIHQYTTRWRHPALWSLGARLAVLSLASLVSLVLAGWGMHLLGLDLDLPEPVAVSPNNAAASSTPAQALARDIQSLQTQRLALAQTLAQLQARWPEVRLPQVLQDIQRTARQHGMVLEVFKPLPLRLLPQHAEQPVQIRVQAAHADVLGFLRDLSQLARPISVTDLHLQTLADKPWLNLEAKLSVLRLLTPQEQAQRKTTAPHQTAAQWPEPAPDITLNPFDSQRLSDWLRQQHPVHEPSWLAAERARSPQWLERFALDQLQWVGQLMQDGQRVALIKAAQRIHQVRIGQYLGPHGGRVLSIDEQTLTLREIFQNEVGQWQQRQVVLKLERAS